MKKLKLSKAARCVVERIREGSIRPEDYDALPVEQRRRISTEITEWAAAELVRLDREILRLERELERDLCQLRAARAPLADCLLALKMKEASHGRER